MNKYLFSSDMDGTILNLDHKLSESTIIKIKKLVNDGHIFTLNTGRPYQGMIYFKNKLEIDCPYVCDNGASIYWDNNPDFPIFFSIDKNTVINFFKEINDITYCAMVTSHKKYFFQNRPFVPSFIIHLDKDVIIKEGLIKDIVDEDILTMTVHVKKENLEEIKAILNKYPQLNSRYWGENNDICAFDIYSIKANKGKALDYLRDYLQIAPNHTVSFGDELNDLELIKHADIGVAMINACDELKRISDDITDKPHYEDGVLDYINKLIKNNK